MSANEEAFAFHTIVGEHSDPLIDIKRGARKIFGIGLSRTGTKSLAAALNLVGVKTKWYPQDPTTFQELAAGNYRLSILEQYDALTDTPVVPFYPQFDQLYPGSKFILTVREKESWLRSCEKHWRNLNLRGLETDDAPVWRKFAFFIDCCVYGCNGFNPSRFAYVYDRHVENVMQYFDSRIGTDLLVLNVCSGEGWEKLCPFLGLQSRAGSFPIVNDFNSALLG